MFVDPPTTSIMLQRTWDRWQQDKSPIYPSRDYVRIEKISPYLRAAVIASEDSRFYSHRGFDTVEIRKSLDKYSRGGKLRGASTISQQVSKNLFLWEGRSFIRKGIEAYITLALEVVLPKERILEIYLNSAEWGDGIFGAEAASRHYFGKSASQLTRNEAARLAVILPSPRRWNINGDWVRSRARTIQSRMVSQ